MEVLRLESGCYHTLLSDKYKHRKPYLPKSAIITAAIPGTVLSIKVKEGQAVKRGDALLVLDSMKMNNIICTDREGVVRTIYIKVGESVSKGAPMVELLGQ